MDTRSKEYAWCCDATHSVKYKFAVLQYHLQVDASNEAIGGVLVLYSRESQFVSHQVYTLNNTEKQYAQIEKERLAIVTCMKKWHQCVFGMTKISLVRRPPTIGNDFQETSAECSSKTSTNDPSITAKYNFQTVYKRGKELYIADTVSRCITEDWLPGSRNLQMPPCLPWYHIIIFKRVHEETKKDPTLKQLLERDAKRLAIR